MRILLIDNYDSFTFNVYQYLLELNNEVVCIRNDQTTIERIEKLGVDVIFISPGPGNPKEAGICLDLVKYFAGKIPIFGICLGHQIIGEAFGGTIVHAKELFHGKTSKIVTNKMGIFKDFSDEFIATRYHSLIVDKATLPDVLEVTCMTEDGDIMGIKHKDYEIEGVQFHPESILTENGKRMLENFLNRVNSSHAKSNFLERQIKQENGICKQEKKNIKTIGLKQYMEVFKINMGFLDVFESLREKYGENSCCILDSVNGPDIDCGNSYIGLFPVYELIINDHKMKIITNNSAVSKVFQYNFKELYDCENDEYTLSDLKFSDIFSTIADIFHADKQHTYDTNFTNGLIGIFSYEYLHYIEKVHKKKEKSILKFPDIHLKYFSCILKYDAVTSEVFLVKNYFQGIDLEDFDLLSILNAYKPKKQITHHKIITNDISEVEMHSNMTEQSFSSKVRKAKQHILDGDIFQIQIGRRLHIKATIDSFDLYKKLRRINPSPYMFFWETDKYQIISNSPELQLRVENGNIIIRPIAGTSKGKGKNSKEAEKLRKELEDNPKEQAEHIMLVDLARNDIGRIADTGSVHVSSLMKSEEFSHVFHLISSVEGKVENRINTLKLFESTFPAGTLTGAPKVKAMEIINELEDEERGPYGGAMGFFDFNGNIISSIIIRTVFKESDNLYLHASAGIVADSMENLEWNEIQHKTETILQALFKED